MSLRVGDWELEEPIGEGGMARVWRGRHTRTGDDGAVKILAVAHSASAIANFLDEVRALATVDHPAIVRVIAHGRVSQDEAIQNGGATPANTPWLTMPLLRGGSAESSAPERWLDVFAVAGQVLDALGAAHAAGLVHGDVKPSNVLLPRPKAWSEALLGDFGLVRLAEDRAAAAAAGRARRGAGAGTPAYMAPEQFLPDPRRVDGRADLYAFGGLLWSLTTGAPPLRQRRVHPAQDLTPHRPASSVYSQV